MKRKLLALAIIAATLAASHAIAANPTANIDRGWVEYSGAGAIRNNNINDNNNASWDASNPGDHIRVMTAVPGPSSVAMRATGLMALGFMARRQG